MNPYAEMFDVLFGILCAGKTDPPGCFVDWFGIVMLPRISHCVSHNEADSSNNSISLFSPNEIGCEQRQWGQCEK